MTHSIFLANRLGRLRQWPWLCLLLTLLLVRAALGTVPAYTNDAYVFFDGLPGDSIPSGFNPMIDAYNFVNNGTFIMANQSLYQTWNTTNYINNGLMESYRFWFDRHTTGTIPDQWATSFYNPGEIYCQYTLQVSATNIVSPGTLTVGDSQLGKIELFGKNVDLSRSTISMPGVNQSGGGIFGFSPTVGAITNFWSPSVNLDLAMPNPSTPPFRVPPATFMVPFQLFNAIAYVGGFDTSTNFHMTQVVFISQPNPAIANNVSFDPANITVQFSGTYVDPTTALLATNYLTIQDNFGEVTNLQVVGNFPVNYTIFESQSIFTPPPPTGLPSGIFGNVSITNVFSYCQVQLASTTVSTNNVANGALTNLPGRIQITASGDLDLTLANISGANYMSLTSTNQFDGAPLQIISPFADIHLSVTNGFMTISNLLAPFIPVWDGTVKLWSARWSLVDTNQGFPFTNSYHVLFVDAEPLAASASAQVQDLILHATNSLVISDVLNVMRTLSIDAQNLTLTTNGYGNGATSPDGELNLESPNIFWPSSLPNLRNLTNNGAIRTMNLTHFGSSALHYAAFVNHGLVSNQEGSTFINADYFENSGSFANSGLGSFNLQSLTTVLTDGSLTAGGDVAITTGSLVASNLVLQAGRSLTLQATNLLTDTGVTNGNSWSVGGSSFVGLNLPIKPLVGDLLGTTIFMTAPAPNKQVVNTWAGLDYGVSTAGYTNNAAIGKLILDALGTSSSFKFNGTGVSNAIYVDDLELRDYAANFDVTHVGALAFNPNLVIYYANATIADGASVAEKLNHLNGNHLRWVPMYTGYFSSTYIVYTNADGTITTNGPFNAALAQSPSIDSDGDGIFNLNDPTPFFVSSEVNLKLTLTNNPPLTALLTWDSIPSATNTVYYRTNLVLGNWLPLTTNISPSLVPPAGGWPITNTITIAVTNPSVPLFYRVRVDPNSTLLYGP